MKQLKWILLLSSLTGFSVAFGQNWKDTLNAARKAYKNGNYREALKYYKTADRLAPNDVDLSQEKGQTAFKAQEYVTAEQCFEKLSQSEKEPDKQVRAFNNLGNCRMKQENYAGAEEAYKAALRIDPSNEKARQHLMEAKRLKQQQEQQQQQENKEQQNQQKDSDPNQQHQQGTGEPKDEKNEQKKDQQKQQEQNQQRQQKSDRQQQESQLKDKQTERKLDDLSRQEMGTKKRLNGSKGSKGGKTARKDW